MTNEDREFALLCPQCGEQNPPDFPVCWSCHADLPKAAPAEEEHAAPPTSPAAPDATRRKRILLELGMVLSILWVPFFAAGFWNAVEDPPWSLAGMQWHTLHGVGLLALLFYLAWLEGDWRRFLGLRRPRLLVEILWGIGVLVAMHVANYLAFRLTYGLGVKWEDASWAGRESVPSWLFVLSFFVFAWVEEVFYRAYLWNRLNELTRRPLLSIAISSLLFSAAHVYPLGASLGLWLSGAILGALFLTRRSLWALVLGHWLFNLLLYFSYDGGAAPDVK